MTRSKRQGGTIAGKPANANRRRLFDLLRNPEQLGRDVGKAYRELRDTIYPPSVPLEEYQKAVAHVEVLEAEIRALAEQHSEDQEAIQRLVLQAAEQDKKLNEIIDLLQKSSASV